MDVLKNLNTTELANFYRRIADIVENNRGSLKTSLAAKFMRHWLDNRDPNSTFEFEAPDHLKDRKPLLDVLEYHRKVFLSIEKARINKDSYKRAGVVPRILGEPPYQKWDTNGFLEMNYESLVEMPIRYQLPIFGDDADRDILYALRGFQLKSKVVIYAKPVTSNIKLQIYFKSYQVEVRDRYDWDYSEHITVPNPDYLKKNKGAIAPTSKTIIVYHANAKRLEDANLAAPYNLRSKFWQISQSELLAPAFVEL
jgi:hypothetical protein